MVRSLSANAVLSLAITACAVYQVVRWLWANRQSMSALAVKVDNLKSALRGEAPDFLALLCPTVLYCMYTPLSLGLYGMDVRRSACCLARVR